MSNLDPNLDLDDPANQDPDAPGGNQDIKKLRAAHAELPGVKEERDRLARELAFTKAGVDTDTPLGAMFAKGYEGELTPEAVSEAFAAIVPQIPAKGQDPEDPENPENPTLEPGEAEMEADRARLRDGSPSDIPGGTVEDPHSAALRIAKTAESEGMATDEAIGLGINSLANAAAQGDQRAILSPQGTRTP